MVCETCKAAAAIAETAGKLHTVAELTALHDGCKGGTHCDCQHIPTQLQDNGSRAQRRQ